MGQIEFPNYNNSSLELMIDVTWQASEAGVCLIPLKLVL